jgi:DNA helicase-2/ATP-dependent DNA helicase PcrA
MSSLDTAMSPILSADGQVEWPKQFWQFLDVFGSLLHSADLDDVDVEAFSENAVAMLTFHQAKGLEFDHVYVGSTGRNISPHSVLRTMLFSGQPVDYEVVGGHVETSDRKVLELAQADREREVYVAMTRAKSHLTILFAPDDARNFMMLNPGIVATCAGSSSHPHPLDARVQVHDLAFGTDVRAHE